MRCDGHKDRQPVFVSRGWVSRWQPFLRATQLYSVRLATGSGATWHCRKNTGTSRAEQSGPDAEERAYDSLLYPLAIGGHFIQCILHTDAHVLNGIKLVHEALSLRVLEEDR